MGMLDSAMDFLSGGGKSDMDDAYKRSVRFLEPFRQPGIDSTNDMRKYAIDYGKTLDSYGNPADSMYRNINRSPNEYYDEIMRGYSESPEAKYLQGEAMRTANNGASASGMLGSGAYYKGVQENAADIAERDRQRYFQNIMGVNQNQMQTLENFQRQQVMRQQILQFLSQLGYGASGGMAGNAMTNGMMQSQMDQQGMQNLFNLAGSAMML